MRDHLSLGRRSVGEVPCVEDDMPSRDRRGARSPQPPFLYPPHTTNKVRDPKAANPKKVFLKFLRGRAPFHPPSVKDLPSSAPYLKILFAAAPPPAIYPYHRRERRTR